MMVLFRQKKMNTERSGVGQRGAKGEHCSDYRALLKALRSVDLHIAELLHSSTVQNEVEWLAHARDKVSSMHKNILFAMEYRKETCHDPR